MASLSEFSYAGHCLRQIWRQSDVAVYERSQPKKPPHELELVVIRTRPDKIMPNGALVFAHEAYPGPSDWGTLGWSFPVRHRAWVLSLAQALSTVTKARGTFVRQAITQFKASPMELLTK
jgi:hypothetical protein